MASLNSRMQRVQSPLIPLIGELSLRYPGTISLGQGMVNYNPPPEAIASISQFLNTPNNHKYQAVQGISPLLEVIANKVQTDNGITINHHNCVVVTAGSNMAFMNAILAITSPGDEIILPTPYYFNHEMAINIANCHPILVATDEHYQLHPQAIAQAITDKTKAIVTISPNNPTGAVYSESALRAVNHLCQENGLYHISDEAYEYFTYKGVSHFSPGAITDSSDYTISLYSLSKAYGFASWRIGYMVLPQHLLMAVKKVQDTILICPPLISQYAALGALQVGVSYTQKHLRELAEVRSLVLDALSSISSFCSVSPADGAFYLFLKLDTSIDSWKLVQRLIQEYQVALLPGTTFGMTDGCYLRLAYGALSPQKVVEGTYRLVQGLKALR